MNFTDLKIYMYINFELEFQTRHMLYLNEKSLAAGQSRFFNFYRGQRPIVCGLHRSAWSFINAVKVILQLK